MFQRKIIESMGQCIGRMPDYSKNDGFMFITQHINSQPYNYSDLANQAASNSAQQINTKQEQLNSELRAKYFECLYEISTKYKPTQLFSAFTSVVFLESILRFTLAPDWASRRKVNEIFLRLFDKYQITENIKALNPTIFNEGLASSIYATKKESISGSNLSIHKVVNQQPSRFKTTRNKTFLSQLNLNDMKINPSREDVIFMRKYGRTLLAHINESLFLLNNRRENYESLYLTICLFLIGLFNENEFLVDLVRFGFHVQDLALLNHDHQPFKFNAQCQIHKFICAYFLVLSKLSGSEQFYDYVSEISDMRKKKSLFHYVYPEYILLDSTAPMQRVDSERAPLNEIEAEFRKELNSSAKEYSDFVQRLKQREIDEDNLAGSKKNLSASQKSLRVDLKKVIYFNFYFSYINIESRSLKPNKFQKTTILSEILKFYFLY